MILIYWQYLVIAKTFIRLMSKMEPILVQLFMIMSIILVISTLLILFLAIKWTKEKFIAIQRDIKSINNLLLKQSTSSTIESTKNDKRAKNSISTTPRMLRKCQEWTLEGDNNHPNKKNIGEHQEEDTTFIVTTRYHNIDNYPLQSPSSSCKIQINEEEDGDKHPKGLIYDRLANNKHNTAKMEHKSNKKYVHNNSLEHNDLVESFKNELNNSYRRFLQTLDQEDSI